MMLAIKTIERRGVPFRVWLMLQPVDSTAMSAATNAPSTTPNAYTFYNQVTHRLLVEAFVCLGVHVITLPSYEPGVKISLSNHLF